MKSTRFVMVVSSIWLAAAGIACLFAPAETGAVLSRPDGDPIFIQVLGTLYLAFASSNWAARGSMIGGIYARPLSTGNFFHFVVGAVVLAKGVTAADLNVVYVVVTLVYLAFAASFALLLFGYFSRLSKHL